MQQRLRSIAFQLFLLLLVEAVVVDVTHGGVVIEDNGYSGVVVALDSDLPQPVQDGGLALLSNLKVNCIIIQIELSLEFRCRNICFKKPVQCLPVFNQIVFK